MRRNPDSNAGDGSAANDLEPTALSPRDRTFADSYEHLPTGICVTEGDDCLYLNPAAFDLLAHSREDRKYLGRLSDIAIAEERDRISQTLRSAREDPASPRMLKFHTQGSDGRIRTVAFRYGKTESPTGPVLVGTLDVSDSGISEEERLRLTAAVFENSLEGVIVCNFAFQILMVNPAFSAITGYDSAEAVGKTPAILRSDRHDPSFYQEMWEMLELSGHWEGEIWNRRKSGEAFPEYLSITAITGDNGLASHYIGVFTDITHRKLSDRQIHRLVHYDTLTDLPNRDMFLQQLSGRLVRARAKQRRVAVIYVDLDHFKAVNDTLGHSEGDHLLQAVAGRLKHALRYGDQQRPSDVIARIGGDEFVVLIDNLNRTEDAALVAEKLLERIDEPIVLAGHTLHVGASLGIAIFPDDADKVDDLLRNADMAMYQAKQHGRGGYQFFTARLRESAQRQLQMRHDLGLALDRQEFRLVYQPQVSSNNGMIRCIEALMRWDHPKWGEVSPMEFIPMLEESGEIEHVDQWVITQACRRAVQWKRQAHSPLRVAVNLSARQLSHERIVEQIEQALCESGLPGSCLEVEITESLSMANVHVTQNVLAGLRELGVRVSIDDFGTGYSSLSYLQHFQVDALKIDRAFIRDCVESSHARELTRSIIALAKSMDLEIVAEGVETEAQRDFLATHFVDLMQGFLFSQAVDGDRIPQLIDVHNRHSHSLVSAPASDTSGDLPQSATRPDSSS